MINPKFSLVVVMSVLSSICCAADSAVSSMTLTSTVDMEIQPLKATPAAVQVPYYVSPIAPIAIERVSYSGCKEGYGCKEPPEEPVIDNDKFMQQLNSTTGEINRAANFKMDNDNTAETRHTANETPRCK